jgi:hypothetical protein
VGGAPERNAWFDKASLGGIKEEGRNGLVAKSTRSTVMGGGRRQSWARQPALGSQDARAAIQSSLAEQDGNWGLEGQRIRTELSQ